MHQRCCFCPVFPSPPRTHGCMGPCTRGDKVRHVLGLRFCVCVCVCARACACARAHVQITFPPHPSTLIRTRARAHARVRALAGINISTHELARERVTSIHLRVSDVYTRTLKEVLILSSQFLEASVFTNLLEQFQKQCLSRVPADFAVVGRVP